MSQVDAIVSVGQQLSSPMRPTQRAALPGQSSAARRIMSRSNAPSRPKLITCSPSCMIQPLEYPIHDVLVNFEICELDSEGHFTVRSTDFHAEPMPPMFVFLAHAVFLSLSSARTLPQAVPIKREGRQYQDSGIFSLAQGVQRRVRVRLVNKRSSTLAWKRVLDMTIGTLYLCPNVSWVHMGLSHVRLSHVVLPAPSFRQHSRYQDGCVRQHAAPSQPQHSALGNASHCDGRHVCTISLGSRNV